MTFSSLFSTRSSSFQSFGVQMVNYIIHKTLWHIELIQLWDFFVHGSVSELLSGPANSLSAALRTSSTVTFLQL